MKKIKINNLQVDEPLFKFLNEEAIPGTNINVDKFWEDFDKAVHNLAPINKELLKKIENNEFKDEEFLEIGGKENLIETLTNKSKNDNSFFNVHSLSLLYTIPKDDFLLIVDNEKNVYLTKVVNFNYKNFSNSSEEGKIYISRSNFRLKNNISNSYDDLLNTKYKVEINQNTMERLKNYFK